MEIQCSDCAGFLSNDPQIAKNRGKIKWVVALNAVMMFAEVSIGYTTGSMSLIAEGWHMASHVGALTITLVAYHLAKSPEIESRLSFGAGKLIPLGGYTSAIALGMVALMVFFESAHRLSSPVEIEFGTALMIAIVGLAVNLISVWILNIGHIHTHHHHGHHHVHDHNIRSAVLHILADAITSVLAILALWLGMTFHWNFLDPLIGIVGALVIFTWSFQLCRDTGWELLDRHAKTVDWRKLRVRIEQDGTCIDDFHIWRIAPNAVACELVVSTENLRGADHYREILHKEFGVRHSIVEERAIH